MLCLWTNRPFWLSLLHCAVLQLWWNWPLCTSLLQQDSSFRNITLPRQFSFQIPGYNTPTPKGTHHNPLTIETDMGRHFNWSQSQHHSHYDRSSSIYQRHTLHSPSSSHSGLCYPLADRCSYHHLGCNTPHRCRHTQSWTCHFSHRCHSHHYSMDCSQSHSSNSHCTAWGPQPMKKAPLKSTIPRLLSSRTPHHILPQIQTTLIL